MTEDISDFDLFSNNLSLVDDVAFMKNIIHQLRSRYANLNTEHRNLRDRYSSIVRGNPLNEDRDGVMISSGHMYTK